MTDRDDLLTRAEAAVEAENLPPQAVRLWLSAYHAGAMDYIPITADEMTKRTDKLLASVFSAEGKS
jgi:hypothetical protein|tara:strand:- start:381 stop:578 length:198 start_codon:yes stop_codon:yes gene_type:complete